MKFTDGVYSCLGCGTDGHARSCVLYNEQKQKENTKSGPSGHSPTPSHQTSVPVRGLDQPNRSIRHRGDIRLPCARPSHN